MPCILLTGATGYIASHTWLALQEAGFDGPVVRLQEPGRPPDGRECATVAKPVQVQALFGAIEHALGLRA